MIKTATQLLIDGAPVCPGSAVEITFSPGTGKPTQIVTVTTVGTQWPDGTWTYDVDPDINLCEVVGVRPVSCCERLSGSVEVLVEAVESVQGDITSLNSQVATLTTSNASTSGLVGALSGQVSSLGGQVSAFDGQLASLDTHVDAIDGQISDLNASIGSLPSVSALEVRVTTLEDGATAHSAQINTLAAGDAIQTSQIVALQTAISAIPSASRVFATNQAELLADLADVSKRQILLKGSIALSASVQVNRPVEIVGYGASVRLNAPSGVAAYPNFYLMSDDISIRNLDISAVGGIGAGISINGGLINGGVYPKRIQITGCTLHDLSVAIDMSSGNGSDTNFIKDVLIQGNSIYDIRNDVVGLLPGGGLPPGGFPSSFYNGGQGSIVAGSVQGLSIVGNAFRNIRGNYVSGKAVYTHLCRNVVCNDNRVDEVDNMGFEFFYGRGLSCVGNTITNWGHFAISAIMKELTVSGNTMRHGYDGIELGSTQTFTCVGNSISDIEGVGISTSGGLSSYTLRGIISNNSILNSKKPGIAVHSSIGTIVSDNQLIGCDYGPWFAPFRFPIRVESSSGTIIHGNMIYDRPALNGAYPASPTWNLEDYPAYANMTAAIGILGHHPHYASLSASNANLLFDNHLFAASSIPIASNSGKVSYKRDGSTTSLPGDNYFHSFNSA